MPELGWMLSLPLARRLTLPEMEDTTFKVAGKYKTSDDCKRLREAQITKRASAADLKSGRRSVGRRNNNRSRIDQQPTALSVQRDERMTALW